MCQVGDVDRRRDNQTGVFFNKLQLCFNKQEVIGHDLASSKRFKLQEGRPNICKQFGANEENENPTN